MLGNVNSRNVTDRCLIDAPSYYRQASASGQFAKAEFERTGNARFVLGVGLGNDMQGFYGNYVNSYNFGQQLEPFQCYYCNNYGFWLWHQVNPSHLEACIWDRTGLTDIRILGSGTAKLRVDKVLIDVS